MRHDRLLRPHQNPWLHPAVYQSTESKRFAEAKDALAGLSQSKGFVECLVVFGGDRGFHTECRFLRMRSGDWRYELDCHEQPFQTLNIEPAEINHIHEHLKGLYHECAPGSSGITRGPDVRGRLPCLWYHSYPDRLLWFTRFELMQEMLIALLRDIHTWLDFPFPKLD